MAPEPRPTAQSIKVLSAFINALGQDLTGADLIRGTRLASGSVYPILFRFEKAGLLESRWEVQDPSAIGRPRRKYYTLSKAGASFAQRALSELGIVLKPHPIRG